MQLQLPEGIGFRPSEPVKDDVPFIEWKGYRYDLHTYSFKEGYGVDSKVNAVKRCTTSGTGLVNNKALLKTIANMRLCASNDDHTGIDTIPSGAILVIKEIQLRNNSTCVYYVRVESIDSNKYKGWVSLSSSHYELYIRGERVVNEWKDENELYQTWTHPAYITEDMIFDKNGITYNF